MIDWRGKGEGTIKSESFESFEYLSNEKEITSIKNFTTRPKTFA